MSKRVDPLPIDIKAKWAEAEAESTTLSPTPDESLRQAIDAITVTQQFTQPKGLVTSHFNQDEKTAIYNAMLPFIKSRDDAIRKDELDRLIDINSNTFNRWTQKDIAHFFDVVGKRYRELSNQTNKGGDDEAA